MENEEQLRSLMLASLEGDSASYRKLLLALSKQLRPYFAANLARFGRSNSEAEDLVQEALLAIHSRKHTYEASQPVSPWVYGIARYKLVDYLRRRKNAPELSIEEIEEVGTSGHAAVEYGLDVQSLLSGLPEPMRRAVQLIKLEGASTLEAAKQAGSSESAVRVNAHRGVKVMMEKLRRGHGRENR